MTTPTRTEPKFPRVFSISPTERVAIVLVGADPRACSGVSIISETMNANGDWVPDYEHKTFMPMAVLDDVTLLLSALVAAYRDATRVTAHEVRSPTPIDPKAAGEWDGECA